MIDEFAVIEARLREQGIECFSIRPETKGVRINYRKNHYLWIAGKKGKSLRDAFVVNGLLDEKPIAPDLGEFEDLLG